MLQMGHMPFIWSIWLSYRAFEIRFTGLSSGKSYINECGQELKLPLYANPDGATNISGPGTRDTGNRRA